MASIKRWTEKNRLSLIFWLSALIFGIIGLVLLYVYFIKINRNGIYMDQIRFYADYVEKVEEGTFQISDLFNFHSGHLGVGTVLLLLFDIKVLGVSPQFWGFLIPAVIAANYFLLVKGLFKERANLKSLTVSCVGALLTALLIFSFAQWEIIEFTWGIIIHFGNFLALLTFLLMARYLAKPRASVGLTIGVFLLMAFDLSFFLGGYGFPFLFASVFVICAYFAICLLRKTPFDKRKLILLGLECAFLIASLVIYFLNSKGSSTSFDLGAMIKSFFVGQTCILFGANSTFGNMGEGALIAIGAIMVVFYLAAVILFFARERYKISFFPLFLLAFSQICIIIVAAARTSFSIKTVGSSRYFSTYVFGYASAAVLLLEELINLVGKCRVSWFPSSPARKMANFGLVALISLSMGFCFGTKIAFDHEELFGSANFRAQTQQAMADDFYFVETMDHDEVSALYQNKYENVVKCFAALRKYNLYLFGHDKRITSSLDSTFKLRGFYELEVDHFWIGSQAFFGIKAESSTKMDLSFYNPEAFEDNECSVFVNGSLFEEVPILSGEAETVSVPVTPGATYYVSIFIAHTTNPSKDLGGADTRDLGLILNCFSL